MKFRVVSVEDRKTTDSFGVTKRTDVSMVCDEVGGVPDGSTMTLSLSHQRGGPLLVAIGEVFCLQLKTG